MRVALASVCRKLLKETGIEVGSRVTQIHIAKDKTSIPEGISPEVLNGMADKSPVRCLDKKSEKELTYQIVGIDEANVEKGLISINSPVARALMGKKIGDSVNVKTPGGEMSYEILKIEYK